MIDVNLTPKTLQKLQIYYMYIEYINIVRTSLESFNIVLNRNILLNSLFIICKRRNELVHIDTIEIDYNIEF